MTKYTTDRIGLAAYLLALGGELYDIELRSGWCWFIIAHSNGFDQCIADYHNGKTQIEPNSYCDRVLWLYKQFQIIKSHREK